MISEPPQQVQAEICPVCRKKNIDSTSVPWLQKLLDAEENFGLQRCRGCGFGWLFPRPTAAQVNPLYGRQYFDRYAGESVPEATPRTTLLDRLRVHLAWRTDKGVDQADAITELLGSGNRSVCDIGCGNGDLLVKLKAEGRRLVGVEPDEAARERCRAAGVEVVCGSTENLPSEIQDDSQDVVVMSHVLEHCHDPISALKYAARITRPGGSVVVDVPNAESRGSISLGSTWFHADYGRHMNFFGARSLSIAAEQVGLQSPAISYYGYLVQFTNGWISAQQENWEKQYRLGLVPPAAVKDSKSRAWLLLLRTLLAERALRYLCVRMVCRKPCI